MILSCVSYCCGKIDLVGGENRDIVLKIFEIFEC